MISIFELSLFLLGLMFGAYILSIFDSLSGLIMSWIESLKAKCSLKITTLNSEIRKISEDCNCEEQSRVIGFTSNSYEEEEEEDECDDED